MRQNFSNLLRDVRGGSVMVSMLLLFAITVVSSGIVYTWVISVASSQAMQVQTQVRIELIEWDVADNKVTVTIRNTGSIEAAVSSIGVKNVAAGTFKMDVDVLSITVQVMEKKDIVWSGPLDYDSSYVIRVTCITGFYYEITTKSPAKPT